MAMQKRFTNNVMVRFSQAAIDALLKKAEKLEKKPAVLVREIVEEDLFPMIKVATKKIKKVKSND